MNQTPLVWEITYVGDVIVPKLFNLKNDQSKALGLSLY